VEKRLRALDRAREEAGAPPGHVPYLGEHLRLVPERGRTRVHRRGDTLLVPASDARAALERWYRRAAKAEIAQRVEHAVATAGVDYERLSIRGQRTRWGSCSSSGTLSFNWRLLLAPEAVLDYVVWHEVCHLRVPDHSKRFWRLVERHVPGYRAQERWLRRYGSALVLPS
jgi:predicted metal-dependent hydrolase